METEQIVFDSSVSSFTKGRFTSFVQMRGSIPAHWSQDVAKMVPKPPIGIDLGDPYAETAGVVLLTFLLLERISQFVVLDRQTFWRAFIQIWKSNRSPESSQEKREEKTREYPD